MSSWISASASPNRNSASAFDSSVFPTPDGPAKMNDPPGRFGSFSPARVRRIACETACTACCCPMTRLCSSSSMRSRRAVSSSVSLNTGIPVQVACLPLVLALSLFGEQRLLAVPKRGGLLEVLRVDRRFLLPAHFGDAFVELTKVRWRRHAANAHARSGLVDEVDRLVRQEPVGDVAVGQAGCCHQGRIGDRHSVVRLVPVAQSLEDLDGVRNGRLAYLY